MPPPPPPSVLSVWIDDTVAGKAATNTASDELDENRPGTNKPRLRQGLIRDALASELPSVATSFHTTSAQVSDEQLYELYDPAYVSVLRDAWTSAHKANVEHGERHWFDAEMQSLTPLNFPGVHHPLLGERPRTLAQLATMAEHVSTYKLLAYWQNDCMTPLYQTTANDARCSVYNTLEACKQLVFDVRAQGDSNTRKTVFYALNSTPGHHSDQYLSARGYCFYNNAAFAAHTLARELGGNISVLDTDAHAGDGTSALFYDRSSHSRFT
jgi:acetoin utilization deacetylase AcuC-like enzyme